METRDYTLHGKDADFDFDVVVYGTKGRPAVVFPEEGSSCLSWENNGMVDAVADLVKAGEVQLFCVDSRDDEGWHAHGAFADYRLRNLGGFFSFVEKELAAFVKKESPSGERPLLLGAGIGALNATVALMRKPELYSGLLALSGTLDVRHHVGASADEAWLEFSPTDIALQLTPRKKATRLLKELPLAFVCGQGEGEGQAAETMRNLEELLGQRGIEATFEYWGPDVTHGWGWWAEELRQLLPCLLAQDGLANRRLTARVALAEAAASHAAQVLEQHTADLAAARAALEASEADLGRAIERDGREHGQVERLLAEEQKMAELAAAAWARKDEAEAVLADAWEQGRAAQAQADDASRARADAEWICGEAEAEVAAARAAVEAATTRIAELEEACANAQEASTAAQGALAEVRKG